ncbi:hypothetical protein [Halomarina oriensis]|nr:hypothetical protein [Halomarina oriensis]
MRLYLILTRRDDGRTGATELVWLAGVLVSLIGSLVVRNLLQ